MCSPRATPACTRSGSPMDSRRTRSRPFRQTYSWIPRRNSRRSFPRGRRGEVVLPPPWAFAYTPRNAMEELELTAAELRKLRALKSPAGIQRYLDSLPYHLADTAWSPRFVLRHGTAHCLEGAVFAAAGLAALGQPQLIFDMEADQDVDHVMAIYRTGGHWGAIAKSNWTGCRGRDPVFRTLRELAMSYFHIYCNRRRERTLR